MIGWLFVVSTTSTSVIAMIAMACNKQVWLLWLPWASVTSTSDLMIPLLTTKHEQSTNFFFSTSPCCSFSRNQQNFISGKSKQIFCDGYKKSIHTVESSQTKLLSFLVENNMLVEWHRLSRKRKKDSHTSILFYPNTQSREGSGYR